MAGMLLKGGASALVGTGAQPPITTSAPAPTTATSASEIAFGPGGATTGAGSGTSPWLQAGGHQVALAGAVALGLMIWLYRSLPA